MNHYVCDKCGNRWQAYRATNCPACSHKSLWEFPRDREDAASAHAARIIAKRKDAA